MRDGSMESINERIHHNDDAFRVTGMTYVGGGETTEDLEEIEVEPETSSIHNMNNKNREFIIKKIQKTPSNMILNTYNPN